jgi:hypothetical protein
MPIPDLNICHPLAIGHLRKSTVRSSPSLQSQVRGYLFRRRFVIALQMFGVRLDKLGPPFVVFRGDYAFLYHRADLTEHVIFSLLLWFFGCIPVSRFYS